MSQRWKIFWIIWLACLAPVLWSLLGDSGTHLARGKAIARIEKIEGNVTVRSESLMIWQKAKPQQELYSNDLISTETKSRVNITFEGGRKLQLSPSSVVKLGLPSPLSNDHEVSVLKGRLVVKAEEPKAAPDKALPSSTKAEKEGRDERGEQEESRIILKTNEGRIVTKASEPQTLEASPKSVESGSRETEASLNALKNVAIGDSMKLSAFPAPPEICPTPPEPEPGPSPNASAGIGKTVVPAFDAELLPLISPLSGEFWTSEPIAKVTGKPLHMDVDLPLRMPSAISSKWKGIINVSGPKGHIRVDGKVASGRKKLSITPKELIEAGILDNLEQSSFAVNAGYSIESDALSEVIEHISPNTGVYSIRSLAEGEGIMVGFNRIKMQSSNAAWYYVTPKTNVRIWIGVTEQEDRRKLFSIVQGNNGEVSRADWPGIPAKGSYIVRQDKIVGIVSASDLNNKEWDDIRKLFNADLIYRGSAQAYISRIGFDAAKTNERTLFVLNKGEFIELDVSLLRTRPNTMRFIRGLSTYLFREQPQVLSLAR